MPPFSRCKVYDKPSFSKTNADPFFLDWYMNGPLFLTSLFSVYAHAFDQILKSETLIETTFYFVIPNVCTDSKEIMHGYIKEIIVFLISALKHRLCVLVKEYQQSMFGAK